MKAAIKDEKAEKAAKELYEKARGLDHIKPKYQKTQEELVSLREHYTPIDNDLRVLGKALQEKNFDHVMSTLGIKDDDLFNYVAQKLKYNQLDPSDRAIYDQQKEARERAYTLEQENQLLKNQFSQMRLAGLESEMASVLADPQVSQVAKAFDTRAGNQGAFRTELARRGDYYWKVHGVYKSPKELAQEVLPLFGGNAPEAPPAAAPVLQSQGGAQASAAPKPVLPNIQGSGASVVKSKVKSIADLKKIRAQLDT